MTVTLALACHCGKIVARFPSADVEYVDPAGEIGATCGEHS